MIKSTPDTLEVQLTRGGVAIVDAADADLASVRWAWSASGYATRHGTMRHRIRTPQQWMHRIILGRMLGRALERREYVDHINHNKLDNTRANLRLASMSQNIGNSKRSKRNQAGYKGVYFCKNVNRWRAKICLNRHTYHLGLFDTPQEAHEAYCKAAQQLFGNFANFE